jgi:hypothetical protein
MCVSLSETTVTEALKILIYSAQNRYLFSYGRDKKRTRPKHKNDIKYSFISYTGEAMTCLIPAANSKETHIRVSIATCQRLTDLLLSNPELSDDFIWATGNSEIAPKADFSGTFSDDALFPLKK